MNDVSETFRVYQLLNKRTLYIIIDKNGTQLLLNWSKHRGNSTCPVLILHTLGILTRKTVKLKSFTKDFPTLLRVKMLGRKFSVFTHSKVQLSSFLLFLILHKVVVSKKRMLYPEQSLWPEWCVLPMLMNAKTM